MPPGGLELDHLSPEAVAYVEAALEVNLGRWVPFHPTPKQQAAFWLEPVQEVLYGGAAGGAKSWWLLGEALRHVDTPGYSAILFRNTLPDLRQEPNGLIPTLRRWLEPHGDQVQWTAQTHTWHFPSGATISFGYLQDQQGERFRRYAGPSWHMIGIDQAEQFRPDHYRFLFSRMRSELGFRHPVRFRATANPGGPAHDFLVERFNLLGEGPNPMACTECGRVAAGHTTEHPFRSRAFMPALLDDNPYLDPGYEAALAELPPVEHRRLRYGDWRITTGGVLFKTERLLAANEPAAGATLVRAWDLAATEEGEGHDPDYSVGALMARLGTMEWVADIRRDRLAPDGIDALMLTTALEDGPTVPVLVEQESRSAGRREVAGIRRRLQAAVPGIRVIGVPAEGNKLQRAGQLARWVNGGNDAAGNQLAVALCGGEWVPSLVSELRAFKGDNKGHDDQVDALAMAHNWLDQNARAWAPQAPQLEALRQPRR